MISLVDVAMVETLREMFPNYPVEYGPPETARQVLAYRQQNAEGKNSTGLPGMTIFRTAATTGRYSSQPLKNRGTPEGKTTDANTKWNNLLRVPVLAEYTLAVWTTELSDRDAIERVLHFWVANYKPLTFIISAKDPDGNPVEKEVKLPVEAASDHIYEWITAEKTGLPIFYGMTKVLRVDTHWLMSSFDPTVFQIDVTFAEPSGDEIVELSIRSVRPPFHNTNIRSVVRRVNQTAQAEVEG